MIIDIKDPRCDIEKLFRSFTKNFWRRVGGPGAEYFFTYTDVLRWYGMKTYPGGTFGFNKYLAIRYPEIDDLINAWHAAGFITYPDHFDEYEILNIPKWCER